MNKFEGGSIAVVLLALLSTGCTNLMEKREDFSIASEKTRNIELATKTFDIDVSEIKANGSEANFTGIITDKVTFSRRIDSRTYLVRHLGFGPTSAAGVYLGSDERLLAKGRSIFQRLGLPLDEISDEEVLTELTRVGTRNPAGEPELKEIKESRKWLKYSREVQGLPVYSSGLMLGLTKNAGVGFAELHWPQIPDWVVREGRVLRHIVSQKDWEPPEMEDAVVESVEAGIIHSAAVGFVMDIYPAIRVIYSPKREDVGRKPVMYYDRHGKPVPNPREFEYKQETLLERGRSSQVD